MLEQIKKMADRFDEIERLILDPSIISQPAKYSALMRERGQLSKYVTRYRELLDVRRQKTEAEDILGEKEGDPQLKALAQEELAGLKPRESKLLSELEDLLLSEDKESARNVIVEIRPGVGGEESGLFAKELLDMYVRYSQRRSWKAELLETSHTDLGGLKYGVLSIEGQDVYKFLHFESGAHRVQRVPATEAGGRIHTSIATVAVLPQVEDVEIEIRREDLRIDTFSAGGPGGQHVNKTQSAVRLTHLSSGVVVECQQERSQTRNRELAMKWLRARLYEHERSKREKQISDIRRTQVGTGDRNEKIRTYNFPQNRVTDHRIKFDAHNLSEVLDGDLDEIVGALIAYEKDLKLKALSPEKK